MTTPRASALFTTVLATLLLLLGVSLPQAFWEMLVLWQMVLLLIVFMASDILLFYIFFESILPPLFLLIGLFGSEEDAATTKSDT